MSLPLQGRSARYTLRRSTYLHAAFDVSGISFAYEAGDEPDGGRHSHPCPRCELTDGLIASKSDIIILLVLPPNYILEPIAGTRTDPNLKTV